MAIRPRSKLEGDRTGAEVGYVDLRRRFLCYTRMSSGSTFQQFNHALGIGASGMTFDDSELPALFGQPLAGLLFTCLGVTGRRTPRAGTPRHPTDVTR